MAGNNNARQILRRDLRNLTEHLARFDARLLRVADCGDALFQHLQRGTLDCVTMPEVGTPEQRSSSGGGRRGRDAERGRAGRDKGQRPGGGGPAPARPGGPPHQARPGAPPPPFHPRDQPRGYARDAGGPRVAASTGAPSPGGSRHRRRRRGGR